MSYKEYIELKGEEKKAFQSKMRDTFNSAITEKFNDRFPPELKIRDSVLTDYIARMSQFSFH